MFSSINQKCTSYYSFGQYLNIIKDDVTLESSRIIDEFINSCSVEQLSIAITQMAANRDAIISDKKNGRTGPSIESQGLTRAAAGYDSYTSYLEGISTKNVPPSMVPSIYAHINGNETYHILVNPNEEAIYEYKDMKCTYTEVLTKMLAECANVSLEFNVPIVNPVHTITSQILNKSVDEIAMNVTPVDTDAIECAKLIVQGLQTGIVNSSVEVKKRAADLMKNGPLTFKSKEKTVSVPIDSQIYHAGIDKYGILDNGAISKAYYKDIGIDISLTNEQQRIRFKDALNVNPERYVYDDQKQKVRAPFPSEFEYLPYNPTWIDSNELTQEERVNLSYYWFVVVPGSKALILKRNNKPIPLWEQSKAIAPYLLILKKVHLFYCLMRLVTIPPLSNFLKVFCERNGISHLYHYLTYSFALHRRNVSIEVNVTLTDMKASSKIMDISSLIMSRAKSPDLEVHDVPDIEGFDGFFNDIKIENEDLKIKKDVIDKGDSLDSDDEKSGKGDDDSSSIKVEEKNDKKKQDKNLDHLNSKEKKRKDYTSHSSSDEQVKKKTKKVVVARRKSRESRSGDKVLEDRVKDRISSRGDNSKLSIDHRQQEGGGDVDENIWGSDVTGSFF